MIAFQIRDVIKSVSIMRRKSPKIFISHSTRDARLAEALVKLIEACFIVGHNDVFCSSMEGKGLDSNDPIGPSIKKKLEDADVVVGLLTFHSMREPWPTAEVAVAHYMGKLIALAAPYIDFKQLPHLLGGVIAHRFAEAVGVRALIDYIQNRAKLKLKNVHQIQLHIDEFLETAKQTVWTYPSESLMKRSEVLNAANGLRWSQLAARKPATLFLWGWSGVGGYTQAAREEFYKMAQQGTQLNFLVLDPKCVDGSVSFGPVCNGKTNASIRGDIEVGIKNLKVFLQDCVKMKVPCQPQLRQTKWFMSWSGVAIDPSSDHGLMQIEFYHYDYKPKSTVAGATVPLMERLNLVITGASEFYDGFRSSLENMWNNAEPIRITAPPKKVGKRIKPSPVRPSRRNP